MNPAAKRFTSCMLLLLSGISAPALADSYGREYSLRTLDPRVAELLVWEICEEIGKKSDRCEVQVAQGRQLVALAPKEVHTRIVRMLVERDVGASEAQGFQIVLVRAASGRAIKPISQANVVRALDAVRELFPQTAYEIVDQGMIRTADRGSMRLGNPGTGLYEAHVRQRSVVTQLDSRELTVELVLNHLPPEGGPLQALSSVLTLAVGETIVAGSSRLASGAETLLVVLTALREDPGS